MLVLLTNVFLQTVGLQFAYSSRPGAGRVLRRGDNLEFVFSVVGASCGVSRHSSAESETYCSKTIAPKNLLSRVRSEDVSADPSGRGTRHDEERLAATGRRSVSPTQLRPQHGTQHHTRTTRRTLTHTHNTHTVLLVHSTTRTGV